CYAFSRLLSTYLNTKYLPYFPTRRSSDLILFRPMAYTIIFGLMFSTVLTLVVVPSIYMVVANWKENRHKRKRTPKQPDQSISTRSEEHTSELQSRENIVCRLLLEKNKKNK